MQNAIMFSRFLLLWTDTFPLPYQDRVFLMENNSLTPGGRCSTTLSTSNNKFERTITIAKGNSSLGMYLACLLYAHFCYGNPQFCQDTVATLLCFSWKMLNLVHCYWLRAPVEGAAMHIHPFAGPDYWNEWRTPRGCQSFVVTWLFHIHSKFD